MLYNYNFYGLAVQSDTQLQELQVESVPISPQLFLKYHPIPVDEAANSSPPNQVVPGVYFTANRKQLLLVVENVAKYLVRNGNEIIIERFLGADQDLVDLFLLGSAFGALLYQRGFIPLHGSSIKTPKGAVVFLGHSGSGKSTMAAALNQKGYEVISDDVSAMSLGTTTIQVVPSYPRILLWDNSLSFLGVDRNNIKPAYIRDNKFLVPVSRFSNCGKIPLHRLYLLNDRNASNISLTSIEGFEKIKNLLEHSYRVQFLHDMELADQHFSNLHFVAKHAPLTLINRPDDLSHLNKLVDILEKDFS